MHEGVQAIVNVQHDIQRRNVVRIYPLTFCLQCCLTASPGPHTAPLQKLHMCSECT